jgi:FkbM family methyltransferase
MLMLSELVANPRLLTRRAFGRIQRRLTTVPESRLDLINGSVRFEHRRLSFLNEDDYRAMLTFSYDLTLCDFLEHHLARGDTVLDVGGNVGYIAAVAASRVGSAGEVHSFEPLRECFARLDSVRQLNPQLRLFCNNFALGAEEGTLSIGFDPAGESRNATLVPGYQTPVRYEVPVRRLDTYIRESVAHPERVKLIKIDVEGFELAVLKGSERFMSEGYRPLIVVEIKPWDVVRIGHSMAQFADYMEGFGYAAYELFDERRAVNLRGMSEMKNVLFRA